VHTWQLATFAFLGYLALIAAVPGRLTARARLRVAGGAGLGAAVVLLSLALAPDALLNIAVLPAAALLIGYWTSGLLFVAPMPGAERFLIECDRRLRIQQIAARIPRPLAEVLEFAYSGVYPLIPIALGLALAAGVSADRFWTTVLVTDYICFGMLAWVQTRPPRALGFDAPWQARWRSVNLRILEAGSVQVNTFPSGHAAEALVCFLLVSGGSPLVAVPMLITAAAISAGTVFGRYHYAADVVAGWAVALLVWFSVGS
jgi:membrane-associated phospholipid phosphatase